LALESTHREEWTYFLPLYLPKRELRLLAIWAYHHRAARFGKQSIGMPLAVLHELGPWLSQGRSIVAGDFNHSVVLDTGDPIKDFSAINAFLENLGLSSAYHGHRNENFGKESAHTLFHLKNPAKPYHIDYCYVHKSLQVNAVSLGEFDEWRRESDHVPVIIDLSN